MNLITKIIKFKESGNQFYKNREYECAIVEYLCGIDVGVGFLKKSGGIDFYSFCNSHLDSHSDSHNMNDVNNMNDINNDVTNIENEMSKIAMTEENIQLVKQQLSILNYNIALCHFTQHDYQTCITYCTRSLKIDGLEHSKNKLCMCYFKVGRVYEGQRLSREIKTKTKELKMMLRELECSGMNDIFSFYSFNDDPFLKEHDCFSDFDLTDDSNIFGNAEGEIISTTSNFPSLNEDFRISSKKNEDFSKLNEKNELNENNINEIKNDKNENNIKNNIKNDKNEKNINEIKNEKKIKNNNRYDITDMLAKLKIQNTLRITNKLATSFILKFLRGKVLESRYVVLILKTAFDAHNSADNISFLTAKHAFIFGDTHGQFFDTFSILKNIEGNGFSEKKGFVLDTTKKYIFNGDFVDRGKQGVENFLFLCLLKILYPQNIFLNRGNHEFLSLNQQFGFEAEIQEKYSFVCEEVLKAFQLTFSTLPICTILNREVFVVHGGLPEAECSIDDILKINRKISGPVIDRRFEGLLWSDPTDSFENEQSRRGEFLIAFGRKCTDRFLERNGLRLIVRSHEFVEGGYRENQDGKVITIFSAPNYCGAMNSAAYLEIVDGSVGVKSVVEWNRWDMEMVDLLSQLSN